MVRLDRLVRSSRDLANIMHELTEMGCRFVSIRESWCDSTSKFGRLLMRYPYVIYDSMLKLALATRKTSILSNGSR